MIFQSGLKTSNLTDVPSLAWNYRKPGGISKKQVEFLKNTYLREVSAADIETSKKLHSKEAGNPDGRPLDYEYLKKYLKMNEVDKAKHNSNLYLLTLNHRYHNV